MIVAVVLAAACSGDDSSASAALAEGCVVNTDCASPLVCAFRKCHTACTASRDCPLGERCVASDRPYHVCQLAGEKNCSYNSQCPEGQTCAIDQQCRDQCAADRDCVTGQRCAGGTCAEPGELQNGHLPVVATDGGSEAGGGPCLYTSECEAPLICREKMCVRECLTASDCPHGDDCASNRCVASSGTLIGPAGGTVSEDSGRVTLTVPPNALPVSVSIIIQPVDAWPAGALGPVFEIFPTGLTFAVPATLAFHFKAAEIESVPPASLQVGWAVGQAWTALPSTVDATASTVSASLAHLSIYGVVGPLGRPDASVVGASPDAGMGFSDGGEHAAGDASLETGEGGTAPFDCSGTIAFADTNLEAAVRTALATPTGPITGSAALGLTGLSANNAGIVNLSGLQCFKNLTTLSLVTNQITDLSPLAGLVKVIDLQLSENQIADISALGGMTSLRGVLLGSNKVVNVAPLAGAVSLKSLAIWGNLVQDVSPLVGLVNLNTLDLGGDPVTNPQVLAQMTSLQTLFIEGGNVTDVSWLSQMPQLLALSLANCPLTDISVLANLTNLTNLDVSGLHSVAPASFSVLSGLNHLSILTMVDDRLSNVSFLAGLTSMRVLKLSSNQLTDLAPLVANTGLGALATVDIRQNPPLDCVAQGANLAALRIRGVALSTDCAADAGPADAGTIKVGDASFEGGDASFDAGPLDCANIVFPDPKLEAAVRAALSQPTGPIMGSAPLTSLMANSAGITRLDGIQCFTQLNNVTLNYNAIADIAPLVANQNIISADLTSNPVTNLPLLAGMHQLQWLTLYGNNLADISWMAQMPQLVSLLLGANPQLIDISPLTGLTNLTQLDLSGTGATNFAPLAGLTRLQNLTLQNLPITSLTFLTGKTSLQYLYLYGDQVSDLAPLTNLTTLTTLQLSFNHVTNLAPLTGLVNLQYLSLNTNQIADIAPLAGLVNLNTLDLNNNTIADLSPLVANTGIGSGDQVGVSGNPPINCTAQANNIATLKARGVTLSTDCP
jgi:Leucine-rich repeat (LRR) protein